MIRRGYPLRTTVQSTGTVSSGSALASCSPQKCLLVTHGWADVMLPAAIGVIDGKPLVTATNKVGARCNVHWSGEDPQVHLSSRPEPCERALAGTSRCLKLCFGVGRGTCEVCSRNHERGSSRSQRKAHLVRVRIAPWASLDQTGPESPKSPQEARMQISRILPQFRHYITCRCEPLLHRLGAWCWVDLWNTPAIPSLT